MSEHKYCVQCGVQIQVGQVTCPNCNNIQPTRTPPTSPNNRTKICGHCGESIDYYSETCPKCGNRQTAQIPRTPSVARSSDSKLKASSYVLMLIIGVRIIGSLPLLMADTWIGITFAFIVVLGYIVSLICIFMKKSVGAIITIAISVIDLRLIFLFNIGLTAIGALIIDALLIILGYLEYRIRKQSQSLENP